MQQSRGNITGKEKIPSVGEKDYYRLCPHCGNFSHENENHAYCSVCGTKLLERCSGCGERIENPVAQFCARCGNELLISKKG